jgi:hypothetical protein
MQVSECSSWLSSIALCCATDSKPSCQTPLSLRALRHPPPPPPPTHPHPHPPTNSACVGVLQDVRPPPRGETAAAQMARFNLLVDAAAADADRDSDAPSAAAASGGQPGRSVSSASKARQLGGGPGVGGVQLTGVLGQAAAVQDFIMQRQQLQLLSEQVRSLLARVAW